MTRPTALASRDAAAACAALLWASCGQGAPAGHALRAADAVAAAGPAADGPNAPVTLNILWRVARPLADGTDYMTTSESGERDAVAGPRGAEPLAYIPTAPVAGTAPLYRLLGRDTFDHADSPRPDEGGYTREGAVGFPWTRSGAAMLPGLTQLVRRTRGRDRALANDGEVLPGYAGAEPLALYGYRRYGHADTVFATLAAGGVTIRSNLVAGCSLWSWQWHGVEFVNVHDLGRQIQTDVGFRYHGTAVLPTEAGSTYAGPGIGSVAAQSAPCVSATAADTAGPSRTQRTRAVPLEWRPAVLGGGPTHPVAWPRTLLGKDITLNFAGLGPVARYTTVVDLPAAAPDSNGVEIPSVYLNGRFSELTLYDAAANAGRPIAGVRCGVVYGDNPGSGYGGVVASTPDGALAFGFYGVNANRDGAPLGGSVTRAGAGFGYARHCALGGTGPADDATTKLRALYVGPLAAGENRFTTYLVSGTRADVLRLMRRLYEIGAR